MTLEHYPGMSEKALQSIVDKARKHWSLGNITIIHLLLKILMLFNSVLITILRLDPLAAIFAHFFFPKKEENVYGIIQICCNLFLFINGSEKKLLFKLILKKLIYFSIS
jgi:hypothetical protein